MLEHTKVLMINAKMNACRKKLIRVHTEKCNDLTAKLDIKALQHEPVLMQKLQLCLGVNQK